MSVLGHWYPGGERRALELHWAGWSTGEMLRRAEDILAQPQMSVRDHATCWRIVREIERRQKAAA